MWMKGKKVPSEKIMKRIRVVSMGHVTKPEELINKRRKYTKKPMNFEELLNSTVKIGAPEDFPEGWGRID